MSSFLFTLFFFIVALGVLITVHEFGHFWVARRLGVKVLRFSIGFGKPLWMRKGRTDDTEYVVAALPLGGYVKMLDEREGEVPEEERHRAFNRQSLPVRTAVVAAGPLFNLLFAILAFWLVLVTGDTGVRPLVGAVKPGSYAEMAGFQFGDEILKVGEQETLTWELVAHAVLVSSAEGGDTLILVRNDQGAERTRVLPGFEISKVAEDGDLLGHLGLSPNGPVVFGEVVPEQAADQAGLKSGDRLLRLNREPVANVEAFIEFVRHHSDDTVQFEVLRDEKPVAINVRIGSREVEGKKQGWIGAGFLFSKEIIAPYRVEFRLGAMAAVGAAAKKTGQMSVLMLKMLWQMASGEASVKNLGGPISIAQSAGKSASYGFTYFLKFLALVSISLGILNLLPIPVLDGGHLLFFVFEWLKGGPLSEEVEILGQRIGLAILLLLMSLAFYVDLARLLG